MAEVQTDDELDRGAAANVAPRDGGGSGGAGVPLADEGIDELPALIALAVGAALLVVGFLWPTIRDSVGDDDTTVVAAAEDASTGAEGTDDGEDDGAEPDAAPDPEPALPDVPAIQALTDASGAEAAVTAVANTVVLVGTVPDEATRNTLIQTVAAQPNVDEVDATGLTVVAPPAAGAVVDASANQVSLVLEGTVPDEATRDAIVARAVSVYSEAQVEDRLEIDPGVELPVTVNVTGSMTDPILFDQVTTAFGDLDGVELGDVSGFVLEESSDLEASLNSLDPIQFATGSAQIDAASSSILDEAADLLNANPDVVLEIGGHTDSVGGDGPNQVLSEARANAVLAALRDRGVGNELTPVGFGERRLKVSPDDGDPEAQAENRRIEFRIIG